VGSFERLGHCFLRTHTCCNLRIIPEGDHLLLLQKRQVSSERIQPLAVLMAIADDDFPCPCPGQTEWDRCGARMICAPERSALIQRARRQIYPRLIAECAQAVRAEIGIWPAWI